MNFAPKVYQVRHTTAPLRCIAATLLALLGSAATAAPVSVTASAFNGTLIDFNALPDRTAVGSQFAALGVTVTGGSLITNNSSALQAAFGSQGASNFDHGDPSVPSWLSITLTFADPIIRIGMDQLSSASDFILNVSDEELLFASGSTPRFVGVEDLDGFNEVKLYITQESNPRFSIDNLRFDVAGGPDNTVPEPGALALAGLALAAAGAAGRLRRRAAGV